ncbi:MAG: hypothetical protein ACRD0J_08215 [Acidimicrobiales bacterium]
MKGAQEVGAMWWSSARSRQSRGRGSHAERTLSEECEAFLAGTYSVRLDRSGTVVPPWAWVNGLAHGDLARVQAIAGGQPQKATWSALRWEPWPAAVVYLAGEVLGVVEAEGIGLAEVQREVLVPLEALLAATPERATRPSDLAGLVTTALDGYVAGHGRHHHPRRPAGDPGRSPDHRARRPWRRSGSSR